MGFTWPDIARFDPILLNLGGGRDCHPHPQYRNFVAVDLVPRAEFGIGHDLSTPIPLPSGSVSGILSEHFLEHIPQPAIEAVLRECHRLLRPGGVARIGVPDYGHPRSRYCLALGHDPERRDHLTLPTYGLMRSLVEASPFRTGHFYQYWDGDQFIDRPIDYSRGYLRRTPDNDPRNHCRGFRQHAGRLARDLGEFIRHGTGTTSLHRETRRYHRLAVTSIVVDLVRQAD